MGALGSQMISHWIWSEALERYESLELLLIVLRGLIVGQCDSAYSPNSHRPRHSFFHDYQTAIAHNLIRGAYCPYCLLHGYFPRGWSVRSKRWTLRRSYWEIQRFEQINCRHVNDPNGRQWPSWTPKGDVFGRLLFLQEFQWFEHRNYWCHRNHRICCCWYLAQEFPAKQSGPVLQRWLNALYLNLEFLQGPIDLSWEESLLLRSRLRWCS